LACNEFQFNSVVKGTRMPRAANLTSGLAVHPTPNKHRGNTLTEFALVIPFLLAAIFGVIEFGRALYAYHFVSEAAREASRWASVRGHNCGNAYPQACPATESDVEDFVLSIAPPGIDTKPAKLVVNTSWVAPPGKGNSCNKFPNNPGCAVRVQITYNFNFILPFLPTSTYPMRSTSEMIISE
jgi:Flp pilus assembly protein TadG